MFIGSSLAITRPRVINGGGGEPPEAVLLFSDSFDGGVIDPAKWVKSVYPGGANYNPGTGERQRYFDANLSVSGGQLIINTVKTLGGGITQSTPETVPTVLPGGFGNPGYVVLTNPQNMKTSDNAYATATLGNGIETERFYLTDFTVPGLNDADPVTGIELLIEGNKVSGTGNVLFVAFIETSGGQVGDPRGVYLPASEGVVTCGANNDNWNAAGLTVAGLKGSDPSFHCYLTAEGGTASFRLDDIKLRVTTGSGITYTSGMINTYGLFQRTYGYYEIEMQTPAKSSVWPAFWLAPANLNWPPEIDVMEGGGGETHHIHVNSHYLISPEVYGADGDYVSVDPTAGFNRYGCNWQPGVLEFYLNRTLSYTVTEPLALPAEDMYMIVNVAVGPQPSGWPMVGDDTDPSAWSVNTYVKEVNVWDIKPF